MRSLAAACVALIVGGSIGANEARAQSADLPFDVPFSTLDEGVVSGAAWRVVDASVEDCVAFARERAATGEEVAPHVIIAGVGFEPALLRWNVVAARDGIALLVVRVVDEGGRCRLEADTEARPVRDGAYRRLRAPLVPYDVAPIHFDVSDT